MTITATDAAIKQIKRNLAGRGKGVGIRLGVRTTGCSGMAYTLEFADAIDEGDLRFDFDGIVILINLKHEPYLQSMELDYSRQGLNEGFAFNNPNEKNRCGCGESFTV
jgi:iron-sulfur cluster assembly protein